MEELRRAAWAHYENSSTHLRIMALNFFESMDTNGDGLVSFNEFTDFLRQSGYYWVNPAMFSQLDANNDGSLDFWEVLTFYYIVKTRGVCCNACHARLHGLHFTCVKCFDGCQDSFDLCASCYGGNQFRHEHKLFLDNYVLLRSKRGTAFTQPNFAQAITQPQTSNESSWAITQPAQNGVNFNFANYCLQALDFALNVANIATTIATGCSIM